MLLPGDYFHRHGGLPAPHIPPAPDPPEECSAR
jgi:hypothetical protein